MDKYIAEALGTFCMVFAGCGAILADSLYGHALGHVGISLTFGLVIMAMIYSVGNVSGAHFNPAITMGFAWGKKLPWKSVPGYITAQVVGAVVAALCLKLVFMSQTTLGETLPTGPLWQSFVLEIIISFILMFVICNVSTGHMEKGIMAGVAIGGTITLASLFAGPVSGGSMNPARSLGPALVSGNLQHLWIYLTAPFIGTFLASRVCPLIHGNTPCGCGIREKD